MTGYVERVGEISRALEILSYHPEGLAIADLAEEIGRSPAALSEQLRAYFTADLGLHLPHVIRPSVIEFLSDDDTDGGEGDIGVDTRVRLVVTSEPTAELGVDMVSVEDLSVLYRAGQELLQLEPENDVLRAGVDRLRETLLPVEATVREPDALARTLRDAAEQHRQVRLTYVRAWRPGVTERVVYPYRVVNTRRGWELDAGYPDRDGVRTFLLSGVQDAEVLAEKFDRPEDWVAQVENNRTEVVVDVVVPHAARWSVERVAESSEVVSEDEADVSLRLRLLPPVTERLGLALLAAGPEAFVAEPRALEYAARDVAQRLLAHHESFT